MGTGCGCVEGSVGAGDGGAYPVKQEEPGEAGEESIEEQAADADR